MSSCESTNVLGNAFGRIDFRAKWPQFIHNGFITNPGSGQHLRCLPLCQTDWSYIRGTNQRNRTVLFDWGKVFKKIEAFHLRFNQNFNYISANWHCKRDFCKGNGNFRSDHTNRSKTASSAGGPLWPEDFNAEMESVPFISRPNYPKILA